MLNHEFCCKFIKSVKYERQIESLHVILTEGLKCVSSVQCHFKGLTNIALKHCLLLIADKGSQSHLN